MKFSEFMSLGMKNTSGNFRCKKQARKKLISRKVNDMQ